MSEPTHPFDQHRYQVRFEWGTEGLRRLAHSDILVVVDVLRFSTTVTDAAARGESIPLDTQAYASSANGAPVVAAAAATGAVVLLGSLRNASAVARAAVAEQLRRGRRTSIAVIAAGEQTPTGTRFAVEDQLGSGAVIDALGRLGTDHTSPEAAVAAESFRGLRGAVRHLLTASASGQELLDAGLRDDVLGAAEVDAASAVPILRESVFQAL